MNKPFPASAEERDRWASLRSAMDAALPPRDDPLATDAVTTRHAGSCAALFDTLSAQPLRVRSSSLQIRNEISAAVRKEKEALSEESRELTRKTSEVEALEEEIVALRTLNDDVLKRRRGAEERIPQHAAVASEIVEEADELHSRHVKNLPKIKKELSLHALMTNIKWDYGRTNVLAGEVSMGGRKVHRRFVIEKEEMGEAEIAERLWELIEG